MQANPTESAETEANPPCRELADRQIPTAASVPVRRPTREARMVPSPRLAQPRRARRRGDGGPFRGAKPNQSRRRVRDT